MQKYYLGLDAHSASCTLAALSQEGSLIRCQSFPTSVYHLIQTVSAYEGQRVLVVEESHLADWVKRTLEPYCDELVICDPKHNQWIWKAEYADDQVDAVKLARLLRAGFIRPLAHPEGRSRDWRSLFLHYYKLTQERTRVKLRLKAEFRGIAIPTKGRGIYHPRQRLGWLKKLGEDRVVRLQVDQYYRWLDELKGFSEEVLRFLLKDLRREKAYPILRSFPGVGPIVAAGYLAILDTPERFSRRNKLWSYAGFGIRRMSSDERVYYQGSSRQGNRILKWVVSTHFQGAMRTLEKNKFQRHFERLQKQGLNTKQARRAVCRTILSCIRAAWRKGETYRDS